MKIVRAKVLATGEGKVLVEGSKPGVFTEGLGDNAKEYKADELEILADSTTMEQPALGGMPKYEPLDTAAMMKEVLDSVKSHFWRDQRVEIAKMLLRRGDVDLPQVPELAEEIVQKLKEYGD